MSMLSDRIDIVIGVDTHTDTHTAAIVSAAGGILHTLTVPSTDEGYAQILDAVLDLDPAHTRTPQAGTQIAWAIEGTGSYGSGLTQTLLDNHSEVIEVRAASRPRGQGKNDTNDAVAIARTALAQDTHAHPRTGQTREAIRIYSLTRNLDVKTRTREINAFKSLVLTCGPEVRERLRGRTTAEQITTATHLRAPKDAAPTTRTTIEVLRQRAASIRALTTRIDTAEQHITRLITAHAPALLAVLGVGPISAAQILLSYSHPGRLTTEAAFAALAGTSPLEASSGRTTRHRLNRTGDRQLNAAIHRIMHTRRTRHDPATMTYIQRRTAEGKTPKEIQRVLKRYITRQIYRLLQTMPAMP